MPLLESAMFAFLLRHKAGALIWQYLDGVIAPQRLDLLQRLLHRHRGVRQQFVDCAVLNALLFAYFNPGRYASVPSPQGYPQRTRESDPSDDTARLDAELSQIEADLNRPDEGKRERKTKRPAG